MLKYALWKESQKKPKSHRLKLNTSQETATTPKNIPKKHKYIHSHKNVHTGAREKAVNKVCASVRA